jgi:hypothetical protein
VDVAIGAGSWTASIADALADAHQARLRPASGDQSDLATGFFNQHERGDGGLWAELPLMRVSTHAEDPGGDQRRAPWKVPERAAGRDIRRFGTQRGATSGTTIAA